MGQYEDNLLVNKVLDRHKLCLKNNKVTNTNFLNFTEIELVRKKLDGLNYVFWGGFEDAERKAIFFTPKLSSKAILEKYLSNTIKVLRIILPVGNEFIYTHRDYLGALISLGIERDKIGDILVRNDGADVIIFSDIAEFVLMELLRYPKFKGTQISVINVKELIPVEVKFEEKRVVLSSLRLDNFVSELANCSRKIADSYIDLEKVLINNVIQKKGTKLLKEKDVLTIRGKGKYIIESLEGKNKKGREVVLVKKYIWVLI